MAVYAVLYVSMCICIIYYECSLCVVAKSRTATSTKRSRSAWTEAATESFFEGLYRVSQNIWLR